MNDKIREKLETLARAGIEYENMHNRLIALDEEWTRLQSVEIASGKKPDVAWWAVYNTPRGKELKVLLKMAEFDRLHANFQYEEIKLAARAMIQCGE